MKLKEYVEKLSNQDLIIRESIENIGEEVLNRQVELLSCSSNDVKEGTAFCVKGAHFKPQYLVDAVSKGAFVYFSEKVFDEVSVPCILVKDIRKVIASLSPMFYGYPADHFGVIGITGTKGKSSTTYFVKSILDEYCKDTGLEESGVVSSIDTFDGEERFESHLTTPEPLDLQRHFANCIRHDIKYMTMEVSSQALKHDRVNEVTFEVGCFLNIGYDHISDIEHSDWEDYFTSKLRIFKQCRVGIVNLDSEHVERVLEAAKEAPQMISFSEKDESADVYGYDVHKENDFTVFKVKTKKFNREFKLSIPGLFNVPNALAAIAICQHFQIPERYIYAGLLKARVPGRMEVYTNANHHIIAIVDYAHNRLSFEKLFESVKEEYPGRRIVIVFGCPGKKAFDRRHDLGQVAGRYSDHVYLTEEDPGEEDAVEICKEIAVHVAAEGCSYSIDPDRGVSIRQAVEDAIEPTVILITGKGAETREKRGIEYIPVPSDVDYTKEALHEYDVKHHMDGMSQVLGLLDTLPKLAAFEGKTIVVKYGGSALEGETAIDTILEDIAALKMAGARVVLVHGGGKNINKWLERLSIPSRFEEGYRVTDDATMEITEMTLSGQVNKRIVKALFNLKVKAVGISGRDGNLLQAEKKLLANSMVDLGHVGNILSVHPEVVTALLDAGFVPVISPVGMGEDGMPFNINADDAAAAIARALKAEKLVFLTDIDGIMMDKDNEKTLVDHLTCRQAEDLLDSGLLSGGMIPKMKNCLDAVKGGVNSVVVLDGRVEHTILLEAVSSQTMGTVITAE